MSNIGKEFKIKSSRQYLNSIGVYEEVIDSKGILKEEFPNGLCLIESKVKYEFHGEIFTKNIMIQKEQLCLIK